MRRRLAQVTLVVRDYDEAIAYFVGKLNFVLCEDTALPKGKRWVVVRPPGPATASLLLARASTPQQQECVGKQAGGRVFLFLETDDFRHDHRAMQEQGVRFVESPREEDYGTVAVFEDLYGNRWDLIEPR